MKTISMNPVGCSSNGMKLSSLLAASLFASFMFCACLNASAQDKSKGKPWPVPEAAAKVKNPVKSDEESLRQGKDIYAQQCKSCHGAKGKGDGPKADKIDISCGDFTGADFAKLTDGGVFWKITEGRKPMPSFKEKLSDQDRWLVVNYIRSLGKAK